MAERLDMISSTLRVPFAASANGVLLFQTSQTGLRSVAWFDREGKKTGAVSDPLSFWGGARLSPDERRLAFSAEVGGNADVWVQDLARDVRTRFTFDPARDQVPVWSPDGRTIVFSSQRKGNGDLYRKPVDGAGAEEILLADERNNVPTDWSPDGRYLLYRVQSAKGDVDLMVLPMAGGAKPWALAHTAFDENAGVFSPDGRWVAYQSEESGRPDVYVTPFPGPGGKRQVSTAGGTAPHWRGDGRELYFVAPDGSVMAAEMRLTATDAAVDGVHALFHVPPGTAFADSTRDGQRFLMAVPETDAGPGGTLTLVQNWTAALKK